MKKLIGYLNGINFGGWFSQCDYSLDRFDNFINEDDFKKVSEWGMDHIRIPFDYNLVQNNDYSFIEDGFNRIEKCILNCKKYKLNMILDLHKTIGFSFDKKEGELGFFHNKEYQDNFYNLWLEIVKRFSKYEDMLAIELLNEVTNYDYKDAWNRIASECIRRIREVSPTIKILVGGYYNNAVSAVKDIDVPIDDNIVFNFHCYEPLIFTHQGAYWIDKMDVNFRTKYKLTFKEISELTKKYCGNPALDYSFMNENEVVGTNYFETIFKSAIVAAEEKGVYLYCGEYGVIEYVEPNELKKWYQDINSVLSKYGIGHALWSYREMDFDFVNSRYDDVRSEVIDGVYQGLLFKESLVNDDIFKHIEIIDTEVWKTDDSLGQWTAISFIARDREFPETLSKCLKHDIDGNSWFVDFKDNNFKYIVLKDYVLKYHLGNQKEKEDICKVCTSLGVASKHLNWSE